jgi:nucleoside-diphosphate-sugar epimerase
MQTVLVAGGAGFIGTTLCETLLKNGHKVICVDNFLTSNSSNIAHLRDDDNFRLIEHNVIEPLTLNEKIDAIFHMASPASPNHHSKISYHALPKETMLVNTTGTFNLLELALRNSAKFLFASTSEVYGDPLEHPQKEDYRGNVSTIGPRSVYDESKRFGETIVSYYGRDKNLDVRIARIFNTYGPRLLKEDMRMIIMFIYEALSNDPITIFGDGTQTRSLCYVDDTVEGLISLGLKDGLSGEVVNIGSSEEHTVLEYANLVKELTGSNSEIKFAEELPKDDPIKRKPDISRAKDILDWEPKISLEEGLQRTIQYIKSL